MDTMDLVLQVGAIHLDGNITPHVWYQRLRYPGSAKRPGKPYRIAIDILAEARYWYSPKPVRDEETGRLLGYDKRFKADLLQRSYQSFAEQFGYSKEEVKRACDYLEQKIGVIRRHWRTVMVNGVPHNNVLFIEIIPDVLRQLCALEAVQQPQAPPLPLFDGGRVPHVHGGRLPLLSGGTNTETTPETTTNRDMGAEARASLPPDQAMDLMGATVPNGAENCLEQPAAAKPAKRGTSTGATRKTPAKPRVEKTPEEQTRNQAMKDMIAAYAEELKKSDSRYIVEGGREAAGARQLVDAGWTAEEVLRCYRAMKKEEFWADKHLSLQSVAKQIGPWSASHKPAAAAPQGADGTPLSRTDLYREIAEAQRAGENDRAKQLQRQLSQLNTVRT